MRLSRAIPLVIVLFVLTLLVRLPAGWALAWLLPRPTQCIQPGGTVWNGYCTRLRVDETSWGGVRWQLHPAQLFKGTLSVSLQSTDPLAPGRADLSWHVGGAITVTDLTLQLPAALTAGLFPRGWSGAVSLEIARARIEQQHITGLQGTATLREIKSMVPPLELGSVQLQFPAQPDGDTLHGTITDLGGPLRISGNVQLQAGNHYGVIGTVSARAGTDDNLANMLGLLGTPDAQGRYMVSLSGSF